jgi:hypothetical protein
VWTGLAVEPLAALLCAASPIGQGHGIEWVRDTAARLDSADPDDPIWDCALQSTRAARGICATRSLTYANWNLVSGAASPTSWLPPPGNFNADA